MQNSRERLAFQPLVLAEAAFKVFLTACGYIYSHQPCTDTGLRFGRVPRSLLCSTSLRQQRYNAQPEPAVSRVDGVTSCHHCHGVLSSGTATMAILSSHFLPFLRTALSLCFKISLRRGWAFSDPRKTHLGEFFLQYNVSAALTLPGMESKRTCREGWGESSLGGLVKSSTVMFRWRKTWPGYRGNPKMDTADEINQNNTKNDPVSGLGLKKNVSPRRSKSV